MIGALEIVIILVIILVIFGARYLPQLGRSAGKGVRVGSEKGKELAAMASDKAKDVDTKAIARQAGEHVREARELRDTFKGEPATAEQRAPDSAPAPAQQPPPAAAEQPPAAPEPEAKTAEAEPGAEPSRRDE